jgi:type IV pilus assembly protein PilQ
MMRWLAWVLLLPLLASVAPLSASTSGRVTGLRLESSAGRTELTVEVAGGAVRWSHFTLDNPNRIVVDLAGARNELAGGRYDDIRRGGVRGVRTSQYHDDVVRIVIDVDRTMPYSVERAGDGVRIVFGSAPSAFEPWSTGARGRAASVSRPSPQQAPAQVQPRPARRITVTFQDADIRDVIASFSEFTGRSIVPGSGVTGTVTADIRNQPWDVALETILRAYGFAARELPSGIIQIDAIANLQERAAVEPLVTQPFRVSYVPAEELIASLQPLSTPERGTVTANRGTGTIIVTDVPSVVANIGRLIEQLDVPTPQVAIEAKIIFIDRQQLDELGIQYDLQDIRGNAFGSVAGRPVRDASGRLTGERLPAGEGVPPAIVVGGPSVAAVGNARVPFQGQSTLDVAISLLTRRMGDFQWNVTALIRALQESSLADVHATPQITTLDNQPARIFVGDEITFLTAATQGGAGGAVTLQPVTVDAGIELQVTPQITADRRVRLALSAQNSDPRTTSANLLQISRQQGTTQLLVADGETAVIGGLTVTRTSEVVTGIPVLRNLPVIGILFRSTRRVERKQDLLIMVTPHIVQERS